MIKCCPICKRSFETFSPIAQYCNPSCRRKAGHEKEKAKASAFYQGPKLNDPRVFYTLSSPELKELEFWADLLEKFVSQAKEEKAVMIYGTMPEGWVDKECVVIMKQWGAVPPCWAMGCLLPINKTIVQMVKPAGKEQREQVMEDVLAQDAEVERRQREAEGEL